MAARQVAATPREVDEGAATAGGSGTPTNPLVVFDDATKSSEILAAFDRAVEIAVRDYADQAIG